MPSIYTRTGDSGETWAPLAGRVRKTHECVEAVGALDEAESLVALAESEARREGVEEAAKILEYTQEALFRIGFQLWRETFGKRNGECIHPDEVKRVEEMIDRLLPSPPKLFQMHAADELIARVAVARAAVRRAERSIWRCLENVGVKPEGRLADAMRLLNRLSDLLFALEYSLAEKRGLLRPVSC